MTDFLPAPGQPFLRPPVSLQVQAALNSSSAHGLRLAISSLARAAEIAIAAGLVSKVHLALGDISPAPCLGQAAQADLGAICQGVMSFSYNNFGADTGPAGAHNGLAARADADFIMVQEADAVPSPRLILNLLKPFAVAGTGMAEAKQVPIELPKDYDPATGETGAVHGACYMMPLALFRAACGFDAASFVARCHDVDLSWAVRLAGYKLITQPAAVVFHDQRLSHEGIYSIAAAARYDNAEAALILPYKWSRMDVLDARLVDFRQRGNKSCINALNGFERRKREGRLPAQIDPDHNIAYFADGAYAPQRFTL